jgi:hypothetical protein
MIGVGLSLDTFSDNLRKVPVHLNSRPVATLRLSERVSDAGRAYIEERWGPDADYMEVARSLPFRVLSKLSLDEITKIRFSSYIMMDQTVEDEYRNNPKFAILNKIKSSMWRWGVRRGLWNEIVDTYNAIRSFRIDHPDFEVRLDYTRGYNENGPSEHSYTYLDGVFAYLIYYKGEHVMTLGFSVMGNYRLLIQQVQLTKRRGNRWLFKLPKNRMEFVVALFEEFFPRHTLYVADGAEVASVSLNSYRDGIERAKRYITEHWELRGKSSEEMKEYYDRSIEKNKERVRVGDIKVAHLSADLDRLRAFYANSGVFKQGRALVVNGLTHYRTSRA